MRCRLIFGSILAATALTPLAVQAAGLPADCSTAAIPTGPAAGTVDGIAFAPTEAKIRLSETMSFDDKKYDDWDLTLTGHDSNGNDIQLEITALIPGGATLDGRSFRRLSFTSGDSFDNMDKQPMATEGTPEIQGWTISYAAHDISESNVFNQASLHLVYGKRSGNTLPGQLYFCAPRVKKSFVAGHFIVDLKAE
jgi:hypothetical protein